MKKITVSILSAMLMLSLVFSSSVFAAEKEVSAWDSFLGLFSGKVATADTQVDGVTYRTHIENDGWAQGWVSDGDMSGSSGRGLRLEGIEIKLDDTTLPEGLGITYRTHIENDGWAQGWVSDGDMSGSSGRGLRLEAIEIKLTGDNADDYSVVYRTHIQNDGWAQGWVKDGALSGSEGRGLRLEGIEIKIEQKTADLTAYEAALAAVEEEDYTEASWTAYEAVVAANPAVATDLQSEVDAATAAIVAAQADLKLAPVVATVTAANSKALTITGVGLDNLVAADIAVADNTVVSYVGSADGKTGTVVLNSDLVVDEVTNVTIKGTVYPVTYTVNFDALQIVSATYDDDTPGQLVAVTMDGKTVTSAELIAAGYNLTFNAYTSKAGTAVVTNFWEDAVTGELTGDMSASGLAPIPAAGTTAYIKLTAVKGSTVIASAISPVTIKNTNLSGDGITASELTLDAATDYVLNSRTLVSGDVAEYTAITVKTGNEEEEVSNTALFKATSSNLGVVSVGADGVTLTAQGQGTATITLTYGTVTRTETITVTNAKREANKVSVTPANLTIAVGNTATTELALFDQYGDPFSADVTAVVNTGGSYVTVNGLATQTVPVDDTVTFTFDGVLKGTASIIFEDTAGVKIGTTTVRATVTDNYAFAKYGLAVADVGTDADLAADYALAAAVETDATLYSTNTTLDLLSNKYAVVDISALTSAGVTATPGLTDPLDPANYDVTVSQSRAGVLVEPVIEGVGYIAVEADSLTGTATVTVSTNAVGIAAGLPVVSQSIKFTVESVGYNLTGATMKTPASPTYDTNLNYEDVLYYSPSTNDDVLETAKLSLTKSTGYPIRLDETTANIYIDKGADGSYDAGTDVIIGSFEVTLVGTFTNAANNITGIDVVAGDDGTVLFKVLNTTGGVVSVKEVKVDF